MSEQAQGATSGSALLAPPSSAPRTHSLPVTPTPRRPEPPPPPRGRRGPRGPQGLRPRPGHIPGLDGLRGLAIIAVLVYHFTPSVLPGGFLGVDVFFVVSGFLITTLLLRELDHRGRMDLPRFWLRRARRLVPALVVVVVISVAAARIIGGDLLVAIGRQTLGALTFSTNWLEISAGASYFSATAPLLFVNFWSLAVEEQFYLLWPFGLVLTLLLARSTRSRLAVVIALALASAVAMAVIFVPGQDASRVYYGTDTHSFSLMFGVALALAWAGPERAWLHTAWWRRWRGLCVSGSVAVLLLLMATLDDMSSWTFRGGIVLGAAATVVLIAGLLEQRSPWRSAMGFRPLTWLGRRSYGIYLWHWPVLMMAFALFPVAPGTSASAVLLTSALVVTLALAAASFAWVETPIRRQGFVQPTRRALAWLSTPWQVSRAPRLIAGALSVLLVLVVAAVITAPDKSATQRQIESAQTQIGQEPAPSEAALQAGAALSVVEASREAAQAFPEFSRAGTAKDRTDGAATPSQDWGYRKDDDGLLVPKGRQLTAIGDSLVVTSADGLTYRFPRTNYVAQSNRQWKDANAVLTQALDEGLVRDNVVVHFGTNAGVKEQQLRSFLDQLGPGRRVVLMNIYGRLSFTDSSNTIIGRVAKDYPMVTVGNWNAAATRQPGTLQSDGIHPDIEGMHVYADVVAESFDRLARSAN